MSLGERMLVDGALTGAGRGRRFENVNPATEEVIGTAPDSDATDFEWAIGAARRAFDATSWSSDTDLRRRCLVQLRDALRANVETLRPGVVAESGSPVALTRSIQLDAPIAFIDHYIDLLDTYEFEQALPGPAVGAALPHRIVRREAVGVVAAFTSWNCPAYLNICMLAGALAAGCTLVLKPAADTPWTALALGELALQHTDIPPGVLNVVTTSDNDVAGLLAVHPDIDAVTLTGPVTAERKVMGAARTARRVTLETGRKSAAVLLDDADLGSIIPALADGTSVHAGQGCAALTRLLVPRARHDEAVELAKAAMQRIPWGDPTDPANVMGPVVNRRQRDRVLSYSELARRDGRVVLGGRASDRFARGWFVEPTLVTDVDPKAAVAQEGVFGPVLVVLPFDGDDDAARIAGDTVTGPSSVYSPDLARAMALARRFPAGTVGVNGGHWFGAEPPFGRGYPPSGLGREWGTEGLEDFLAVKTIAHPGGAG